jgi:hypothetical protein
MPASKAARTRPKGGVAGAVSKAGSTLTAGLPRRVGDQNEHDQVARALPQGSFACPHGRWRTITVIGAGAAWMEPPRPRPIEGATDTEVSRAYVQEVLVSTPRAGDLVVMDNLAPHKNEQTVAPIRQVGADVVFLPPYLQTSTPSKSCGARSRLSCAEP